MPSACGLPVAGQMCKTGESIAGAVAGSAVAQTAQAFQEAQVKVLGMMLTLWAKADTPVLSQTSGPVAFLQRSTHWLVGFLAVLGLLIAAGKLAWQRRGEPAKQAAEGLLTLTVVTGTGVAAVSLLTQAGDAYSTWIIARALGGGDFSGKVTQVASLAGTRLDPGLMIIVAFFAIISSLLQMGFMVVRSAMLGLLTGALPIGAAISGTEDGKAWFKKMVGWLLAFILYKPVAATIYAYSLTAMGTPDSELAQLSGIVMIILAVVALPVLMKFLAPMVSATTRGGGGSAGMAIGTAVATGARLVPAGGSGSYSAAPAPASGRGGASSPTGSRQAAGGSSGSAQGGPSPAGSGQTAAGTSATSGATGGTASGRAASSGAAAVAGPPGAAVTAGIQAAQAAKKAAQGPAENPTGGGPSGSQ